MSLVNDMLRDLEARRAAPAERERLSGLYAANETAAARRAGFARLRRWLLVIAALVLAGIALALLSAWTSESVEIQPEPVTPIVPVSANTRLLEVLPQNDGSRFVLQLLLDRAVSYQRTDEGGSVSLQLSGVQLNSEARSGRIETQGQSLSWRVEAHGDQVQVLFVGLAERLQVRDRLETAGDRWQLWLEVPLNSERTEQEPSLALPVAEPETPEEASLPEWVTREAPANQPEPVIVSTPKAAPAESPAPSASPSRAASLASNIGRHTPSALEQARQALHDGDHPRAIRELQALHEAQPKDPQVVRWLARAYLAVGETQTLLAWLPAQLQARPFDSELRELLARAQLQGGDNLGAITTLRENPPELFQHTAYHALLAALYQQVEDWTASAAIYRQLVAARPDQASWQLGLAISLEQLDQPTQASGHYQMALQGQGLDESARRFASERAASLGGTQ
ncbi:tetratricopeptide repeat protein [Stutzerimonas nitrititolerans]|uniref:tetratricopeptide repeat protein n=1 Tax=Stutzerimonas nitrititolerans TaxID=2482751 RepID=UPI00289CD1E8|nr:hypothetical protein [Stutzerimonas nitrititolerans]